MEKRVALLIVYNHRYDKNIPRLEKIYKDRFSNRFHLVPFYDGNCDIDGTVIPVVGHSYFFQVYLCQAYYYLRTRFGEHYFSDYFIVADDMIIHPNINENNIWGVIGINKGNDFFPTLIELQTLKYPWRAHQALRYKRKQPGVEILNEIPTVEEAKKKFDYYGVRYDRIPLSSLINPKFRWKRMMYNLIYNSYWKFLFSNRELDYPLVGGYSDIFLVTDQSIERFIHFCGAFAASGLFVEFAIPTSLLLASNKVKFFKDVKMTSGALWREKKDEFLDKYNYNLDKLVENFPDNVLFLHPVKLSKWNSSVF